MTLGVFAYLFLTVDLRAVGRGFMQAPVWFVPASASLVALAFVADTIAAWKTFSWFCAPISVGETLIVRGSAYLIGLINYTVGQGAFAYFLHRTRGVTLVRCAATVLLVMGINLIALLLLVTMGLLTGRTVVPALGPVTGLLWGGLALYAVVVTWKPRWLASRPLFDVLLGAGLGGHIRSLAVRLPHVAVLVAFSFLNLRAFGIDVPLVDALLLLPVVYFVSVLPISVQGLGTGQATMVLLFQKYATTRGIDPKAMVFASSLASQAVATAVQLLIGLLCLRTPLGRTLYRPAARP